MSINPSESIRFTEETRKCELQVEGDFENRGFMSFVRSSIYFPKISKIVSSFNDGSICFWNSDTCKREFAIRNAHDDTIRQIIKWDEDDDEKNSFLSCGNDGDVWYYEIPDSFDPKRYQNVKEDRRLVFQSEDRTGFVSMLKISKDCFIVSELGDNVFSSTRIGKRRSCIIDFDSGKVLKVLKSPNMHAYSRVIHSIKYPHSLYFLTSTGNASIIALSQHVPGENISSLSMLVDYEKNEIIAEFPQTKDDTINSGSVFMNTKHEEVLVLAGDEGDLYVINVENSSHFIIDVCDSYLMSSLSLFNRVLVVGEFGMQKCKIHVFDLNKPFEDSETPIEKKQITEKKEKSAIDKFLISSVQLEFGSVYELKPFIDPTRRSEIRFLASCGKGKLVKLKLNGVEGCSSDFFIGELDRTERIEFLRVNVDDRETFHLKVYVISKLIIPISPSSHSKHFCDA